MMPRKTIILRYNQKHLLRPTTRWFCGYMTADLPQSLHKNCCTYDLNPNHLEKPITINPRKLRSTVAHHMIAIGVPMNVISEVLRHKDKATAPRHYTQITDIEIVRHAMNSVRFNTQADSTGNKTMFRYSVIKVQTQKMSQIKSTSGWSISRIFWQIRSTLKSKFYVAGKLHKDRAAIPVMNWSVDVIFLKTGKISTKVGELA